MGAQGQAHFSSGCGFMVVIGKPKLCIKFEVPSFSHCVNVELEPPNFGELSYHKARPCPLSPMGVII